MKSWMLIVKKYRLICAAMFIASMSMLGNPLQADTLVPFTSDGCSAFPDGTFAQQQLWLSCCERHDYDYWKGGHLMSVWHQIRHYVFVWLKSANLKWHY
jgi:hypothetical protein